MFVNSESFQYVADNSIVQDSSHIFSKSIYSFQLKAVTLSIPKYSIAYKLELLSQISAVY
jgi:hypothetical protein